MRRPAPLVVAVGKRIDPGVAEAILPTIRTIRRMLAVPLMTHAVGWEGNGPVGATTLFTTMPLIPQWEIGIIRSREAAEPHLGCDDQRNIRLMIRCHRNGEPRLSIDTVEAYVQHEMPRRRDTARHVLAATQSALSRIAAGGPVVDVEDAAAAAWMHVELVLEAIDADRNGATVIGPGGAMASPARTLMRNAVCHLDVPWPGPFADRSLGGDRRQPSHAGHPVREAGIPVVAMGIDDGVVTLRQVVAVHRADPVEKLRMIGRDARFRDALTRLGTRP